MEAQRRNPASASNKSMTAPVSLAGLFVDSDDSSDNEFTNEVFDTEINVGGDTFTIREKSFHPLNANAVWPGEQLPQTAGTSPSRPAALAGGTCKSPPRSREC